jgi:hypothetical protein
VLVNRLGIKGVKVLGRVADDLLDLRLAQASLVSVSISLATASATPWLPLPPPASQPMR